MFWWIHGIFFGIAAIFWGVAILEELIGRFIMDTRKIEGNPIIDLISDADELIIIIINIFFPITEAGILLGYNGLKREISPANEESRAKWIENHPGIDVDIYRSSMHDSLMKGWWIALGIIVVFIAAVIITEIIKYKNNSTQRELEKVKQAYCKASDSNIPEIKAMVPLLKKTIRKIELQEEMKTMSTAIKSIKKLQNNRDYVDVQKELDELNAMYELDNLEAKYKK